MHTRTTPIAAIAALLIAIGGLQPAARAADEDTTARVREMLHRTQEALRQTQGENADLVRAKTDVEQKLEAVTKQLEAARGVSKAEVALRGQLQETKAAQDDLTHKLSSTAERLAEANTKLNESAKQLAAREAELAQVKQGLEQSKAVGASCETKNLKLYSYSQDLLQAYRKKGVWAALSQKDPVFGLKEVDIENVVQEYQVKFAGQKIKP
jgi:chromosome segregation ATPase